MLCISKKWIEMKPSNLNTELKKHEKRAHATQFRLITRQVKLFCMIKLHRKESTWYKVYSKRVENVTRQKWVQWDTTKTDLGTNTLQYYSYIIIADLFFLFLSSYIYYMCGYKYTYMWGPEINVRNHCPSILHFIHWGRISQSNPELPI